MSVPADLTIGFLGAGRMATALAAGLVESGSITPERVMASDVSAEARDAFAAACGGRGVASNAEVIESCRTVVLAVKPQVMGDVLSGIRAQLTAGHLLISVVAGQSIERLTVLAGDRCRIVRVMPNTPCLVGAGASAYARGWSATDEDASLVQELLSTVGMAIEVPELLLDAVTGLSGSGPAYVFQFIEALSDGGVRMGLPREIATRLSAQTVLGAAKMVLETGQHPGVLKDGVTSPGGTTIAGLHAMEQGGVRGAVMDAVRAAVLRSQELGRM